MLFSSLNKIRYLIHADAHEFKISKHGYNILIIEHPLLFKNSFEMIEKQKMLFNSKRVFWFLWMNFLLQSVLVPSTLPLPLLPSAFTSQLPSTSSAEQSSQNSVASRFAQMKFDEFEQKASCFDELEWESIDEKEALKMVRFKKKILFTFFNHFYTKFLLDDFLFLYNSSLFSWNSEIFWHQDMKDDEKILSNNLKTCLKKTANVIYVINYLVVKNHYMFR